MGCRGHIGIKHQDLHTENLPKVLFHKSFGRNSEFLEDPWCGGGENTPGYGELDPAAAGTLALHFTAEKRSKRGAGPACLGTQRHGNPGRERDLAERVERLYTLLHTLIGFRKNELGSN